MRYNKIFPCTRCNSHDIKHISRMNFTLGNKNKTICFYERTKPYWNIRLEWNRMDLSKAETSRKSNREIYFNAQTVSRDIVSYVSSNDFDFRLRKLRPLMKYILRLSLSRIHTCTHTHTPFACAPTEVCGAKGHMMHKHWRWWKLHTMFDLCN